MILGNNTKFLVNYLYVAGSKEVAGKEGWLFWAGGGRNGSCYIKNKLKSEILNDKNTTNQNDTSHN